MPSATVGWATANPSVAPFWSCPTLTRLAHGGMARLRERGLTPHEETIARRYYSEKERSSMDESSFCGPHQSFPVTTEEDMHNAVSLLHHAADPSAVRACIIKKAHEHGWALPTTWENEKGVLPDLVRGEHEPMTGSHAHSHPSYDDQGDDENHSHMHSHQDDNKHNHEHAGEDD